MIDQFLWAHGHVPHREGGSRTCSGRERFRLQKRHSTVCIFCRSVQQQYLLPESIFFFGYCSTLHPYGHAKSYHFRCRVKYSRSRHCRYDLCSVRKIESGLGRYLRPLWSVHASHYEFLQRDRRSMDFPERLAVVCLFSFFLFWILSNIEKMANGMNGSSKNENLEEISGYLKN